jgi:hypothetical protein
MGVLEAPTAKGNANRDIAGSRCPECGNAPLIDILKSDDSFRALSSGSWAAQLDPNQ